MLTAKLATAEAAKATAEAAVRAHGEVAGDASAEMELLRAQLSEASAKASDAMGEAAGQRAEAAKWQGVAARLNDELKAEEARLLEATEQVKRAEARAAETIANLAFGQHPAQDGAAAADAVAGVTAGTSDARRPCYFQGCWLFWPGGAFE